MFYTLSDVRLLALTGDKTLNRSNAHTEVTLQRCPANTTCFNGICPMNLNVKERQEGRGRE